MRFLTPTENRHLNELVGFLGVTLAVLVALSLLSYSPRDASLNVSAPPPGTHPARNWIGPVGAHGADLLFQGLGYAAFLLPVGIFLLGVRWFRSQPVPSPLGKSVGYALLLLSLPVLLTLWHLPEVRGTAGPGGLLGTLLSESLVAGLNSVGAHLVAVTCFLAALFLTTSFSIIGTHQWLRGPLERLGLASRLQARWMEPKAQSPRRRSQAPCWCGQRSDPQRRLSPGPGRASPAGSPAIACPRRACCGCPSAARSCTRTT